MLVNGALNLVAATLILIAGWTLARWLGTWLSNVLGRAHYIDATVKPLLAVEKLRKHYLSPKPWFGPAKAPCAV